MALPFNIPIEFALFAFTLIGVAVFHRRTLEVTLTGLTLILAYKFLYTDFELLPHLAHEWHLLLNLFGLLIGFAMLARHFEDSGVPELLPRWLPDDWKGGFMLLVLTWLLSTFLDNIAAAVIGGVVAKNVFNGRVTVGYLAAIVAAANAGGAGSVIGDTTTTMMWIAGVPALHVADAFIAAVVALLFSGVIASRAQHRVQPIRKNPPRGAHVHPEEIGVFGVLVLARLAIVVLIVSGLITTNVLLDFPAIGAWLAILVGGLFHPIPWGEARRAIKGSLFLVALVLSASLMPVTALPDPSWQTTFGLGWVSAVFDNIPLTALALQQGGYDWGLLAFAVGYGGSMIWFGSSAGVAISNIFPEAKNTLRWIKEGWHVPVAYVLGFFVMLWLLGWKPDPLIGM
ncbi:MAG: citrate transporter [Gammaproteobacteria bacterium]|nr:citrate transporter [Gammaproteobacteria bacterium]